MKASGFPKTARLLKPRDYSEVFSNVQVRVPHKHFLILATPNALGHARIGLVFSKKHLKLAVQRNRVKRVVRETFRLQPALPSLDIVVLGRQGLAAVDNPELHTILNELWQRLVRKARSLPTAPAHPDTVGLSKGSG
ncbi:ribonuclease P protein component [Marinobacter sp. X15-166B]|uniref:ribonuclease P protein component n=1 Tax=Marinobacter sp. X15-166B TaxID=1897620 RepID=UPI00085C61AE|nr:ribonuclease P protein component [Marinobacter sp. X15-166B]OEY66135.1 ribonuclease P protein component [Marinobacter sp. X15-166B]